MKGVFTFLALIVAVVIHAQQSAPNLLATKLDHWQLQPIVGIQLWSTYTFNEQVFDAETATYQPVDNRWNTQLRRTRIGVKGQPYPNLKFAFIASLDLVGRDLLTGTEGGSNNGSSPAFRIWNAYVQWKLASKSDGFNLTMGYLPPQIGRDNITAALRVTSMEKSWSQNYLRRHIVGTGPGRALGINLGGEFLSEKFGWSYDTGIFNPLFQTADGNSMGVQSSPLLVGRVAFYFGDPESKNYTLGHKVNYFGERNGLTLAFATTYQGTTDLYQENTAYGLDWLFNWENWNISGEWSILERKATMVATNENPREISSRANTGFVRAGYNIEFKNGRILEPVLMLVQFNGATTAAEQADAEQLRAFAGKDHYGEANLNFYFNPDLKLSLSYTFRNGQAGDSVTGATFNNYFYQAGIGAIQRGNWLGLGFVGIF